MSHDPRMYPYRVTDCGRAVLLCAVHCRVGLPQAFMTLERPASGLRLGHETRIEGDETFEAFDAARPGTCVTDPMTKPQRRPLSRVETAAERPSYYVSLLNLSLEDDRVREEIGVRRAKAQRPLTSVHISRGVKAALSQELRRTADQGRVTSPVLAPSPRTLPVSSSRPASPDVSAILRDGSVGSPSWGPAAHAPADPATVDAAPLGDVYGPEYARDLLARSERTGASAFLSDALTQSQRRQRPVAPVSIDALLTHTHRQAEATPKHKARPAAVPVDLRRAGSAASRLLFSYPGDGDLGLKQRAAARAAFAAEVSQEMEFEPSLAHRRRDEHAALERRRRRPQHTSFSFLQGGPDVPSFVSPTPTPQPRPFSPSTGPVEPSRSTEPVSAMCQVAHHVAAGPRRAPRGGRGAAGHGAGGAPGSPGVLGAQPTAAQGAPGDPAHAEGTPHGPPRRRQGPEVPRRLREGGAPTGGKRGACTV